MTRDEGGRNLLDQQYPKEQAQRACHRPRHRRRSSRKRWGRTPVTVKSQNVHGERVDAGLGISGERSREYRGVVEERQKDRRR